jgi:hypothetical protein
VRDTVNLLKRGVPSVVLVHQHFERLAHAAIRQLGLEEDSSLIVVAYPTDRPSAETQEQLEAKAHEIIGRVPTMLTSQKGVPVEAPAEATS